MIKKHAHAIAFIGLWTALALIFSYIESLIPFSMLGIPGLKLGLANAVTLFLLYQMKSKTALSVSLLRILLSALLFGIAMLPYSLAGGLLSYFTMLLMKKLRFSILTVSAMGGVMHNVGQLLIAALIVENIRVMFYLPLLLITGTIMGFGIGMIAKTVFQYTNKQNFQK